MVNPSSTDLADRMGQSWFDYLLNRPEPKVLQTQLVHDRVDFMKWCLIWSLYFSFLCVTLPKVIKKLCPKMYKSMDPEKQAELPAFASGILHHIIIVPMGVYEIYLDYHRTDFDIDYVRSLSMAVSLVPFTFGYIFADTLFLAAGEILKGKYAYAIHHAATFVLYYCLLSAEGPIIRFMPHLFVCEASNIVFEIAFFMRAAGHRDTLAIQIVEALFAITFFLTRIFNLPICIWAVLKLPGTKRLPSIFPWTLGPIVLLQFFWFGKILIVLAGKFRKRRQVQVKKRK